MAAAVESDNERAACLRRVLSIDPGNEAAARVSADRQPAQQQPAETQAQPPEPKKRPNRKCSGDRRSSRHKARKRTGRRTCALGRGSPTGTPVPGTVESAPPAQPAARAAYQPEVRAKPSQPALSDLVKVFSPPTARSFAAQLLVVCYWHCCHQQPAQASPRTAGVEWSQRWGLFHSPGGCDPRSRDVLQFNTQPAYPL